MLVQRYNSKHKRKEWALVSLDGSRVLQWFGPRRPSEKRVEKTERRVRYFKHKR